MTTPRQLAAYHTEIAAFDKKAKRHKHMTQDQYTAYLLRKSTLAWWGHELGLSDLNGQANLNKMLVYWRVNPLTTYFPAHRQTLDPLLRILGWEKLRSLVGNWSGYPITFSQAWAVHQNVTIRKGLQRAHPYLTQGDLHTCGAHFLGAEAYIPTARSFAKWEETALLLWLDDHGPLPTQRLLAQLAGIPPSALLRRLKRYKAGHQHKGRVILPKAREIDDT